MLGRLVNRRICRARPEVIRARVAGDAEEPRLEPSFAAPCRAVLQYADEHVLHEVFGYGSVAGHSHQKIEERPMMTLEQHPKLGDVPVAHGLHECFVGHSSVALGKHDGRKKVTFTGEDELVCFLPKWPGHASLRLLAAARDCGMRRNSLRAVRFR